MPSRKCYDDYTRYWDTNDGGRLIDDPVTRSKIIPALEREEIHCGYFPRHIAEVRPEMFLDFASVLAIWEEKHIAVARMQFKGVATTHVNTGPRKWHTRRFLSYGTGIYTREEFAEDIQDMEDGYFHIGDHALKVTGCRIYIHA